MKTNKNIKGKHSICNVCLSQDRNLYSLGVFEEIYEVLCRNVDMIMSPETWLCWECIGFLRKVRDFQYKIYNSQSILSTLSSDEFCSSICLSTLSVSETIILDTFEHEMEHLSDLDEALKINKPTDKSLTEFDQSLTSNIETKNDIDIENELYKEYIEETVSEENVWQKISEDNESVIEDTEKDDTNVTNPEYKKKNYINIENELYEEDIGETVSEEHVWQRMSEDKESVIEDTEKDDTKVTNTGYKKKNDIDIENELYEEDIEETVSEENEWQRIAGDKESVIEDTEKDDTKVTKKHRIRNYPKDRRQRYTMTYQSIKWEEAVEKILINSTELKEWLERERSSDHFRMLKNKCDICLQKLKIDENLRSHERKFHTPSTSYPLTCDVCSRHFSSKTQLQAHLKRHYYIYRCNNCSYKCYSQLHMRYHLRKSHGRTVTCLVCGKCYKNTREFYVHLRSHPVGEYYLCDQCNKKTKSLQYLERHIARSHKEQRCEECDLTFKTYKLLVHHNKYKHTYDPTEASFCAPCDKQFNNAAAYKMHLLTAVAHSGERGKQPTKKEVPCPVCLKVYSKNETMMNHYRWVHTHDSRYRCEECDQPFLNRTRYKNHMQYQHMGLKKPRNKICAFCNRGFTTNQSLQNHVLIHTGDRPHKCPECSQLFRQETTLKSHIKYVHMKLEKNSKNEEIYVVIPYGEDSCTRQGSSE